VVTQLRGTLTSCQYDYYNNDKHYNDHDYKNNNHNNYCYYYYYTQLLVVDLGGDPVQWNFDTMSCLYDYYNYYNY